MQLRFHPACSYALRRFAPLLCLLTVSLIALPAARAQSSDTIDLAGPWKTHVGDDPAYGSPDTRDTLWPTTVLPASQGAGQPGIVWYRKHFQAPADWGTDAFVKQTKQLVLDLGTPTGALEVVINGSVVAQLGKLPTDTHGKGYVPVTPLAGASDVEAAILTAGSLGGKSIQVFNFGGDNLIALRVYAPKASDGITTGTLAIKKPNITTFYPYSRTLSKSDGIYDAQDPVTFTLTFSNPTSDPVDGKFSLGITNDLHEAPSGYSVQTVPFTIDAGQDKTYNPKLSFVAPDFYVFTIKGAIKETPLPQDQFVVGYETNSIRAQAVAPADLTTFWNAVRQESAAKPLNVQATPEPSVSGVNVFRIQYDGLDGKPARAWLSLPVNATGKVPAVLELPAYDQDFTGPNTDLPSQGIAVMRFIATAPDWTSGNTGADYVTQGIDSQKTYVYRTIIGNALRALDILEQRPEIDAEHLGVAGASQGGGLALIVAGLAKNRVKAVVAGSPFLTLWPHSIKAASQGPYVEVRQYQADHAAQSVAVLTTLSYFDTVHFCPFITAPVYMPLGLLDKITPPYASYATANELKPARTVTIDPAGGHAVGMAGGFKWLVGKLK